MTDTPNTKPSEAIQRYDPDINPHRPVENGNYVRHSDALAWVARAREEARTEALEEAAQACEQKCAIFYAHARVPYLDAAKAIRALLTTTPQGETKEQQP